VQPYLSDLSCVLNQQGYSRNVIRTYLCSAEKFGRWLTTKKFSPSDADAFAAVNIRKLDGLDQFQWRRIRGKCDCSRCCPRSDRERSNTEEIPLVRTHKSPPFKAPQISVQPEAMPQMPRLLR
jgi:hypothetical protein